VGTKRRVACSGYASKAGWEDVLDFGNVCIVRLVDRSYEAMPVNVCVLSLFRVRAPPAYRQLVLRATGVSVWRRQQYAPDSVSSTLTSKF